MENSIVINNEFDYSNCLPTIELISVLVEYCDQMNKYLTKLVDEDEEKNKQYKYEYRNYNYGKAYGQSFEVSIWKKGNYNSITCNNFSQFKSAIDNGNLGVLDRLEIKLCMDYFRGKADSKEQHDNSFIISFRPYDIKFIRKSNFNDMDMEKIENQINEIMKKFPVANTIFCYK